ncbi:MAG: RHS repeat-associated core domain-containing protein [Acidobacteriota bacterium]
MALAIPASSAFAQCPPPGPANWCSGTYQYDAAGNIKTIGADTYVYDELGRLVNGTADVQRTGQMSRQYYEYDPFGNRTNVFRQAGSVGCLGGCELSPALTVNAATNHISNHNPLYDDAGNLTRIDSATYSYDGASMLARAITTDDRQYIYTADDERIATRNGLSWTWTVRGLDQKVLREFTSYEVSGLPTSNRQWAKDYVWRDGLLLASVTPGASGNVVQHYHLDHLGTPRVVSNGAGLRIGGHAYYPFGAELMLTPHEPTEELMKFTGHERDVLGNDPHTLDMMHARYEMATLGRFLSVDAHPGDLNAPQSWNRYPYARNNPVRMVDLDGNKELEFKIRHFIPAGSVQLPHGLNIGDGRTFSLSPNASVRTERTIRIETDAAIDSDGLLAIDEPRIGASYNAWFGSFGRTDGKSMAVSVSRIPGWGVLITATQNEPEPVPPSLGLPQAALFLTGRGGIRSTVNIFVNSDGTQIDVFGQRSSFPAMEINASVGQQTFSIYRGNESRLWLGLGIFGKKLIDKQCKDSNGNWTCH